MSEKPKRIKLDVRAHATFGQRDGSWWAAFPYFELETKGSSEEEAWDNLQEEIRKHIRTSPAEGERWDAFVKEHGVEEEVPEDELRKRRELIETSHAASAGFRILDSASFDGAIASEKPLLVDFWAEWCMPCHMVAPVLKEVADHLAGRMEVAKMNVDENNEFWKTLSIEGIPTMILFSKGGEVTRLVGAGRSKEEMVEALEPHLG